MDAPDEVGLLAPRYCNYLWLYSTSVLRVFRVLRYSTVVDITVVQGFLLASKETRMILHSSGVPQS